MEDLSAGVRLVQNIIITGTDIKMFTGELTSYASRVDDERYTGDN